MESVQPKAKEGRPVAAASARSAQAAAPPAQPKPDHNEAMRLLAHQRLDELFTEAIRANFYGVIGIEITWEAGRVKLLHRKLEGRDKP